MSDDLESQRKAIREALAQRGHAVAETDPEVSPTDQMLDDINAGKIEAVVTYDRKTGSAKVHKIERP